MRNDKTEPDVPAAAEKGSVLSTSLWLLAFFASYLALQAWVLPACGIQT